MPSTSALVAIDAPACTACRLTDGRPLLCATGTCVPPARRSSWRPTWPAPPQPHAQPPGSLSHSLPSISAWRPGAVASIVVATSAPPGGPCGPRAAPSPACTSVRCGLPAYDVERPWALEGLLEGTPRDGAARRCMVSRAQPPPAAARAVAATRVGGPSRIGAVV